VERMDLCNKKNTRFLVLCFCFYDGYLVNTAICW
jgi:hypothetical protein